MECPVDPDMSIVGITHAKVRLYMNIYANAVTYTCSHNTNIDLINHELCLFFSVVWGTTTHVLRPQVRTPPHWILELQL